MHAVCMCPGGVDAVSVCVVCVWGCGGVHAVFVCVCVVCVCVCVRGGCARRVYVSGGLCTPCLCVLCVCVCVGVCMPCLCVCVCVVCVCV